MAISCKTLFRRVVDRLNDDYGLDYSPCSKWSRRLNDKRLTFETFKLVMRHLETRVWLRDVLYWTSSGKTWINSTWLDHGYYRYLGSLRSLYDETIRMMLRNKLLKRRNEAGKIPKEKKFIEFPTD